MSEGVRDVWQELRETVDRTVAYIHDQRAQNKTQKETILKQQKQKIPRFIDLLETKRNEVIFQEEKELMQRVIQFQEMTLSQLEDRLDVEKLQATSRTERLKADYEAKLRDFNHARAAEHLAALEAQKATSMEEKRRLESHYDQLVQEAVEARASAEEAARQLKEDIRVRDEAEATARANAERERIEAEREEAERIEAEEQRQYPIPEDDELRNMVLQFLVYKACTKPDLSTVTWNKIIEQKQSAQDKFRWYVKFFKDFQQARETYNNSRPIKTFLAIRYQHDEYGKQIPLVQLEGDALKVNTYPNGMIQYSNIIPIDKAPTESLPNNFTVVTQGGITKNFNAMLPKFLTTSGVIDDSRTIITYGPSGSGKTSLIKEFLNKICGEKIVEFVVVEMYGYDHSETEKTLLSSTTTQKKKESDVLVFLLKNKQTQVYIQEKSNEYPVETIGKKLQPYETVDDTSKFLQSPNDETSKLIHQGKVKDIIEYMNSGVYKRTEGNDESSRGFMFIKIKVNDTSIGESRTYHICDFPGSEENIAQQISTVGSRLSFLIAESTFFSKMLPYFQSFFEAKQQRKNPLDILRPKGIVFPPIVIEMLTEWFVKKPVAMVLTALGNFSDPITKEGKKKNFKNYNLSVGLFEFVKNLDARENCIPLEVATEYFGKENRGKLIVENMIDHSKGAAAIDGGSKKKITRKRYGKRFKNTRSRR